MGDGLGTRAHALAVLNGDATAENEGASRGLGGRWTTADGAEKQSQKQKKAGIVWNDSSWRGWWAARLARVAAHVDELGFGMLQAGEGETGRETGGGRGWTMLDIVIGRPRAVSLLAANASGLDGGADTRVGMRSAGGGRARACRCGESRRGKHGATHGNGEMRWRQRWAREVHGAGGN